MEATGLMSLGGRVLTAAQDTQLEANKKHGMEGITIISILL